MPTLPTSGPIKLSQCRWKAVTHPVMNDFPVSYFCDHAMHGYSQFPTGLSQRILPAMLIEICEFKILVYSWPGRNSHVRCNEITPKYKADGHEISFDK